MKLKETIPASIPKLIRDYLDKRSELQPFTSVAPDLNGLQAAASARTLDADKREVLTTVLLEQAIQSPHATDLTRSQIERLGRVDTFTVTTGHQLCIYGGPLFFFYKILSVVNLSQQLKGQGVEAVPVFWMASEDHDFEEINHIHAGDHRFTWEDSTGGPVGRLALESLDAFKKTLKQELSKETQYEEVLDHLDELFSAGKTLAQAMCDFAYWVFADMGLVVLDADDARLKRMFAKEIQEELSTGFSNEALQKQSEELETLGYPIQVHGREINLFWMEDGYRERIVRDEQGFATADGKRSWSSDELCDQLEQHPECFSPNVVLRPLYQEVILPNICYVGGPGELSYWLQLKGVFDQAGVDFPAVILRDMYAITNEKIEKRLGQLGIGYEDVMTPIESLFTELVRKSSTHEHLVTDRQSQINQLLEDLIGDLSNVDPNMERSAKAEQQRIQNRLEQLSKKVLRSDKKRHEITRQRLEEVYAFLRPDGVPQERVQNWLAFTNDPASWCASMAAFSTPLKVGLKVVED